uniref:Uncharacterized protein n=1 Tax=Alexandrium monilatum TaxID=311494 RepID=A0A7S4WIL8_9DINO|mmetsp:Transcript_101394/g.322119  ORF Transcript_101394/g.322119 Transcript_101394/m.322119 type:complete len:602 (+) Transcript_101394:39-1844(+)
MPVPAGWDQAKAHERAVQLLEGAAPFEEQSGSIEFSHGTWRQRRAEPRAISSSLPAAAEVALKESRRAAVQALPESKEADHAAVLRRTWTDIDFDGGEDANQKLVQALEAEFAEQLASTMHGPAVPHAVDANDQMESSCEGSMREVLSDVLGAGDPEEPAAAPTNEEVVNVLGQSDNLGASLDMIGAYLKNYMTDKADMVLRRVMPLCRERGGFWLIKALNIAACVCSKQGRHEEALTALEELERLVGARLADLGGGEAAAWAFYDMVYKNFGWTLEALGRHAEAFGYFERAAELKRASGVAPTWFDQWDLGRTLAHMAYELGRGGELSRAGGLLRDALELQHRSEPGRHHAGQAAEELRRVRGRAGRAGGRPAGAAGGVGRGRAPPPRGPRAVPRGGRAEQPARGPGERGPCRGPHAPASLAGGARDAAAGPPLRVPQRRHRAAEALGGRRVPPRRPPCLGRRGRAGRGALRDGRAAGAEQPPAPPHRRLRAPVLRRADAPGLPAHRRPRGPAAGGGGVPPVGLGGRTGRSAGPDAVAARLPVVPGASAPAAAGAEAGLPGLPAVPSASVPGRNCGASSDLGGEDSQRSAGEERREARCG